jgi:hypothetical protein
MAAAAAPADNMHVYFGTYTGTKSRGIYLSSLNAETGELGGARLAAEISPASSSARVASSTISWNRAAIFSLIAAP